MTDRFYDKTPDMTASVLGTNTRNGLSRKEAASRLRKNGMNTIYPVSRGSFVSYLKHIVTDFMSILLIITAAVAWIWGDLLSASAMIAILLLNYAAAIYTYVRAHRVLENMGHAALPTAKVLRDGRLYLVKQEQLVEGDIIFLSVGDMVPADARLIDSDGLTVFEANLTGEVSAARKDAEFIEHRDIAPAKQKNMVFAATIVTKGTARAIVTATGAGALCSKLEAAAPMVTHEKLRIHAALKKYCGTWSLFMIAMIFIVTIIDVVIGFRSRSLFEIFLTGLSLAASSMSEFYTAFGYIIIGCGVYNAAKTFSGVKTGALIKNSSKLEVMKDITCLVVPKEGVFSVHDMRVDQIYVNGNLYKPGERKFSDNAAQMLKYAVVSTGLYGGARLVEDNLRFDNINSPEEEAIIAAASSVGVYNVGLDAEFPIIAHASASDTNPFETTLAGTKSARVAAIRGELGSILERCRYCCEHGRVFPLSEEKIKEIKYTASLATRQAYRIVGVASRSTVLTDLEHIGGCQTDMTFEGFLAIREPLLPGAAKNVSKCQAAGIKVIMLCDDISENNRYLAEAVGVTHGEGEVITGSEMASMKEGLFRANLPIYKVYEGLSVNQKRALVKYLQADGEVVGVMARGLGEMPLINEGDVGFASSVTLANSKGGFEVTGRRVPVYTKSEHASDRDGCEAVKFQSDVIISASDKSGKGGFNAIVGAIGCAKVIYLNLLRMLRYLIVSQCARFFVVLYSVLTHTFLLSPVEILFGGLICDFMAVIIIAFERPAHDILSLKENTEERLNHPFTQNVQSILFGLLWAVTTIGLPQLLSAAQIIEGEEQMLTVSFVSMILTQVVVLVETMREKSVFIPNVSFNGIFVAYILGLLAFILVCIYVPSVGAIFGITALDWMGWLSCIALPLLVMIAFEAYKFTRFKSGNE